MVPSSGSRIRNWSILAILFSGALYTCYKFYKVCLFIWTPQVFLRLIAEVVVRPVASADISELSFAYQILNAIGHMCTLNLKNVDDF